MHEATNVPGRASGDARERTSGGKVVSIALARAKKSLRDRPKPPPSSESHVLELRGVDLERFTPAGRDLYWHCVTDYARELYGRACEASYRQTRHPYAPVGDEHVEYAEPRRRRSRRQQTSQLGLGFILDALTILGSATCGALATQPLAFGGAGILPLAVAITLTICVFLLREGLTARD
jgi:hypothetical protein